MKSKLLLVGFVAAMLTSCSTYKAGQTPDDVYYSPAREAVAKKETRRQDRYEDYVSSEDDRYLKMKIRNRDRWSTIDDYDYWYDSRYVPNYSYNYYRDNWNSPYMNNWNTGYYQPRVYSVFGYNNLGAYPNYYRNGYGNGYGYGGYNSGSGYYSKTPVYITKRPADVSRPALDGYNNRNYNNRNSLGNTIMKAFTPSESNYNNSNTRTYSGNNTSSTERTYSAPERTYTPPASNSSSSSSSSSSGGGVSRPARNGGN